MDTCNKAAQAATIAQDAPVGNDAQQAAQPAGSDPVKDLEDMRRDFGKLYDLASEVDDYWTPQKYAWLKSIGKKWGLE